MKSISKTTGIFFSIFVFSLFLLVISLISQRACETIHVQVCQRIRTLLSNVTSALPFSVFELSVFLSPFFIAVTLKYIARGEQDSKFRFYKVLSLLSLFASLYILTLGISYKSPSLFSKYGKSVSAGDLIITANTLKEAVNYESEFITDESNFYSICEDALTAFERASQKHGLAPGKLPRPKPLISSKLVSYTGALAIYSFPTGEININVNVPTYIMPFTVLHELGHSRGVAGETDANFLAYLTSLESDSHILRYSASLSILEYILADIRKTDYDAFTRCFEGLSERAQADINSWHRYSEKYQKSMLFRAFDYSNTRHLERWDKNGTAAYSAVSVYVTNYLRSA